ncbi:g3014 [Coccomyxa elongata]
MPKVKALYVYPVKSLKGISLTTADVSPIGFTWDRHWLITRPDGRFLTQRQIPRMTLISTALPPEALTKEWSKLGPDASLTLTAPGMEPLQVPLVPRPVADAELKECTCWDWKGLAQDEGEDAAAWLTNFLGKPVRLVRYVGTPQPNGAEADPKRRECELPFGKGIETAFADGYPFLIATESSLADLNNRMPEPLPMDRFRPNLVIDDSVEPWAEDDWHALSIVGPPDRKVEFLSVKPCSRCKVTTTDQETGAVGREPLMTLGKFRSGKQLGWSALASWKHEVFFGWNLAATAPGTVAVGDDIIVTRKRTTALAA